MQVNTTSDVMPLSFDSDQPSGAGALLVNSAQRKRAETLLAKKHQLNRSVPYMCARFRFIA